MRSHLEERAPLETEFQVQLKQGQSEWWQMRGSAQRSLGGHPTQISGCMTAMPGGGQKAQVA
jgi:hypothetical protein